MTTRFLSQCAICCALVLFLAHAARADHLHAGESYTFKGRLIRTQIDYLDGRTKAAYQLETRQKGHRDVHDLRFPKGTPDLPGGSIVTVRGKSANGKTLSVNKLNVNEPAIVAAVTGTKKAAAVLINFQDQLNGCTPAQVQQVFFGTGDSVDSLFRDTSNNALSFTGDVLGPVTIKYPSTGPCDYRAWASAARTALTNQGVNLGGYNYIAYALPGGGGCGWAGLGEMPGNETWNVYCGAAWIYRHEIGHNLGMHHAATGTGTGISSEYGDESDPMGSSGRSTQVNAPHRVQMGWMPSNQVLSVQQNGTYSIAPLESDPSATGGLPQVLKLPKADTTESYYLSFRRALGFDANLPSSFLDRLSIHRHRGGASQTVLLSTLGDSESYTDPVNGLILSVLTHTSSDLSLSVSYGCGRAAPSFTFNPWSYTAAPGSTRDYTVTITNKDTIGCDPSLFLLAPSLPSGWSGTLSSTSMTLASGTSGSVTFSVTSASASGDGSYPVGVAVSDAVTGAHNTSSSGQFTIDASPPTAPSNLTAATNRRRKAILSWGASSDPAGIKKYHVFRNGQLRTTTTSTSYSDSSTSGATNTYYVAAEDNNGMMSAPSNSVSATIR